MLFEACFSFSCKKFQQDLAVNINKNYSIKAENNILKNFFTQLNYYNQYLKINTFNVFNEYQIFKNNKFS